MTAKKKKLATIIDVAKLAGVSIGTVSNVLNGTANVSDKTQKKVKDAMTQLSFHPNGMARSLRATHSKLVGLLVPDISNEYYSKFAKSFFDAAYNQGYTVMLAGFEYDLEREQSEIDVLIEKRAEAIVIAGGGGDEKLIETTAKNVPVILADRNAEHGEYSSVEFDNRTSMKRIVEMVSEAGYRRIGYITEPITMTNLHDRYLGFLQGMEEQNLKVNDDYIYIYKKLQLDKEKHSYDFMKSLLGNYPKETLPEIFVTSSDMVAMGMMDAIKDAGYSVPEDFGIVGYDNVMISKYLVPPLTTVMQNVQELGRSAWDVAYRTITSKTPIKQHVILEQEILIRESCKITKQ